MRQCVRNRDPRRSRISVLLIVTGLLAVAAVASAEEVPVDYTDLSLSDLLQTDVIYGASKFDQQAKDAPSSVTIVTSDEIKHFGYRNLAEVLGSARGFYTTYDRNYQFLGTRGFGRPGDYNSRVLVMIDGVRTNENVYGSALLGESFPLDLDLVHRIEIVRGPSSSIYGASAIFAIVNIITKSVREYDHIQVAGQVGSFGAWGGQLVAGSNPKEGIEGLEWLVSGSAGEIDGQDHYYAEFDDPATNDGVFENADRSSRKRLFGKVNHGSLHLEALYGWSDKLIPTAPWSTQFNDPRTRTTDNLGYLSAWYDGGVADDTRLLTRVSYGLYDYEGDWIYDYAEEGDPQWLVLNRDDCHGRWLNTEMQLTRHVGSGHLVAIGGEYTNSFKMDQAVWDSDPYWAYFDDRREANNSGLYALGEWRASDAVRVNAGVRRDDFSSFGSSTNPRLAVVAEPRPGSVIKVLYGSAFRAPNAYELYYDDGGETQKANPDLDPETIQTYELVFDQALGSSAHVSLSAFQYTSEDLIDQRVDPDDGLLVFRNNDKVEAFGYELEIQNQSASGLKSALSYSYHEARNTSDDKILSNAPRQMAKLHLLAPVPRLSVTAGVEVQYLGPRRTLRGRLAGEALLANLTLVYVPLFARYEVIGGVYNLFDVKYGHPGGAEHLQDAIGQDGVSLRLAVTLRR